MNDPRLWKECLFGERVACIYCLPMHVVKGGVYKNLGPYSTFDKGAMIFIAAVPVFKFPIKKQGGALTL
jgi:hypothetical protein